MTLQAQDGGTLLRVHALAHGRWADDLMHFGGVEAGWQGWLEAVDQWIIEGTTAEEAEGGTMQASVKAEDLGDRHRLYFKAVTPGGAAEEAGIRPGDTFRYWNGTELNRVAAFWSLFWKATPGEQVQIGLEREGVMLTVSIRLAGNRPAC